jgi:hypothetical protein
MVSHLLLVKADTPTGVFVLAIGAAASVAADYCLTTAASFAAGCCLTTAAAAAAGGAAAA